MLSTESTESNERLHHRRATAARHSRDYKTRCREARAATATETVQSFPNYDRSSDQEPFLRQSTIPTVVYDPVLQHAEAHRQFKEKFSENNFGYACSVCDRLWYDKDLKPASINCVTILAAEFPNMDLEAARVCNTCHASLRKEKIPTYSTSKGFKYLP